MPKGANWAAFVASKLLLMVQSFETNNVKYPCISSTKTTAATTIPTGNTYLVSNVKACCPSGFKEYG